jgi:hypothetical protein
VNILSETEFGSDLLRALVFTPLFEKTLVQAGNFLQVSVSKVKAYQLKIGEGWVQKAYQREEKRMAHWQPGVVVVAVLLFTNCPNAAGNQEPDGKKQEMMILEAGELLVSLGANPRSDVSPRVRATCRGEVHGQHEQRFLSAGGCIDRHQFAQWFGRTLPDISGHFLLVSFTFMCNALTKPKRVRAVPQIATTFS